MDLKQRVLLGELFDERDGDVSVGLVNDLCNIIREQQLVIDGFNIPIQHINKEIKPTAPNSESSEITQDHSQLAVVKGNEIYQQHFSGYFR